MNTFLSFVRKLGTDKPKQDEQKPNEARQDEAQRPVPRAHDPVKYTAEEFAAEQQKMLTIRQDPTVGTTEPTAELLLRKPYDVEADRLLEQLRQLPPPVPPLIQTTREVHFLNLQEKIKAEVLSHNHAVFGSLPRQELIRALGSVQTTALKRGPECARRQAALQADLQKCSHQCQVLKSAVLHLHQTSLRQVQIAEEIEQIHELVVGRPPAPDGSPYPAKSSRSGSVEVKTSLMDEVNDISALITAIEKQLPESDVREVHAQLRHSQPWTNVAEDE